MKEEGMPAPGIVEKFQVSKRYGYKLVNFERRASTVAQLRRVVGRA